MFILSLFLVLCTITLVSPRPPGLLYLNLLFHLFSLLTISYFRSCLGCGIAVTRLHS